MAHLVLIGGGHAHLTILANCSDYINKGHRVILIGPNPYHYYSGMGPGMLAGTYLPDQIRFPIKQIIEARGGSFVEDRAVRIDPHTKTVLCASGTSIGYDVLSCNTGSTVSYDHLGSSDALFAVKPIETLLQAREHILNLLPGSTPGIVVIGGGPAGLEMAGAVRRLVEDNNAHADITLIAGTGLLKRFPEKARYLARSRCKALNIAVREDCRVEHIESQKVILSDGKQLPFDAAIIATGIKPSSLFAASGLQASSDGGLTVNTFLQSVTAPEIFGGGDCIHFQDRPLDKVGVYAVRESSILHNNLMAALENRPLVPFFPQEKYMLLLNMGDDRAFFCRNKRVYEGRLFFKLKDFIDRSFMKKFSQ